MNIGINTFFHGARIAAFDNISLSATLYGFKKPTAGVHEATITHLRANVKTL
jgi:hypothetical protein